MNRRGQVVSRQFVTVAFPTSDPGLALPEVHANLDFLDATGLRAGGANPGGVELTAQLQALIPAAVDQATATLRLTQQAQTADLDGRLAAWRERAAAWTKQAEQLEVFGSAKNRLHRRERRIVNEREIAESLAASQQLVRPLVLVVPRTDG
jgi:hypothetical protein